MPDKTDVNITGQDRPLEVALPPGPIEVTQAAGSATESELAARATVEETRRAVQAAEVVAAGGVIEAERAAQASEVVARAKAEALELLRVGQRRINLIWELTQAVIAIVVTTSTLFVAAHQVVVKGDLGGGAFLLLSNAFFLIIGFYFSRTNHQNTGGVGEGDKSR